MSTSIEKLITALREWPSDDVAELLDVARLIEARRSGVYEMTSDERSAVEEGLAQARSGEFVSDQQMEAIWSRLGA